MQFNKVHQELAKPVYLAIPKIAEKARKKCSRCEGTGKSQTPHEVVYDGKCSKCRGTGRIGAEEWKWKPEIGERYFCYCPGHELPCVCLIKDKQTIEKIKIGERPYDNIIPLLHWEDHLEPILKKMGYDTPLFFHFGPEDKYEETRCGIYKKVNVFVVEGHGKDRQESVQRGILALVKGLG